MKVNIRRYTDLNKIIKECKHIVKYTSKPETWFCGKNHCKCGFDTKIEKHIMFTICNDYEPVTNKQLSIAEKIIRDALK